MKTQVDAILAKSEGELLSLTKELEVMTATNQDLKSKLSQEILTKEHYQCQCSNLTQQLEMENMRTCEVEGFLFVSQQKATLAIKEAEEIIQDTQAKVKEQDEQLKEMEDQKSILEAQVTETKALFEDLCQKHSVLTAKYDLLQSEKVDI